MITDALVPPKPNEFDNATLISRMRGVCGTRSMAVSIDGLSRLMVGGAMLWRIARTLKIHPTAPPPPTRRPVDDLVDDIHTLQGPVPQSHSPPPPPLSPPTRLP